MKVSVRPEDETPGVLPAPASMTLFDGLQGRLLLRPWYDWCGVRVVVNWYFPVSRAWAAALEARGDIAAFECSTGNSFGRSGRLEAALGQTAQADQAYRTGLNRWEQAFFGATVTDGCGLVAAELARQKLSKRRMLCRKAFLRWRRSLPKLRWSISAPQVVAERHETRLQRVGSAFEAPAQPGFECSRMLYGTWSGDKESRDGVDAYRQYWLRFPSLSGASNGEPEPASDETSRAWAKVYEPAEGGADAPCLIFLHGIGMETDHWGELADPVNRLTREGFRVIRPEAPWHGFRGSAGYFGGEPAIAQGPLGFIELFHAAVREVALLIEWARNNGSRQVAVGGLSLGALTAQIVAARARNWPAARQPDQLLLVTTSDDMLDIALRGSMARLLEMPRRFEDAGWSADDLARWRPLLEPHGDPVMPGDRVVMLLGEADDLTPIRGGENLACRWRVPEENIFRRRQGHFSASLGLYRDRAALDRLAEIVFRS